MKKRSNPARSLRAEPVSSLKPPKSVYTNLLVPIDFSPASGLALKEAKRLAEQTGATLTLVHVLGTIYDSNNQKHLYEEATKRILEQARKAKLDADDVKVVIRNGVASRDIVELAKQSEADLIVIATHGAGGMKRFLLGSTAEWVVRHAPCPVLVVRERQRPSPKQQRGDIFNLLAS